MAVDEGTSEEADNSWVEHCMSAAFDNGVAEESDSNWEKFCSSWACRDFVVGGAVLWDNRDLRRSFRTPRAFRNKCSLFD